MNYNLFETGVPLHVICVLVVGIVLLCLEINVNLKGVAGILSGVCFIMGIVLSFISGVPIIEQVFVYMVVVVIALFTLFQKNKDNGGV